MCTALCDFYSCGLRTSPQLRLGLLAKEGGNCWYKTSCSKCVCVGDCGVIIALESDLVLKSPLILCHTSQRYEGNSRVSNKSLKSEGLIVYHIF